MSKILNIQNSFLITLSFVSKQNWNKKAQQRQPQVATLQVGLYALKADLSNNGKGCQFGLIPVFDIV